MADIVPLDQPGRILVDFADMKLWLQRRNRPWDVGPRRPTAKVAAVTGEEAAAEFAGLSIKTEHISHSKCMSDGGSSYRRQQPMSAGMGPKAAMYMSVVGIPNGSQMEHKPPLGGCTSC